MRKKSTKIFIDIRARLKVQKDSLEARIDRYLKDEDATPYVRHKLIIEALSTYYLPLILQHQGATTEEVRQGLVDVNRAWQGHMKYLQQKLGIDLTEETPPSTPSTPAPSSIPVPIAFPINYGSQQYIEREPQRKPEPEIKSQAESEQEGEYTHVFD